MSWDAMIMVYPDDLPSFDELPENWKPEPMADSIDELRRIVSEQLEVKWFPDIGQISSENGGIDIRLDDEEPLRIISVNAWGNPIPDLLKLVKPYGWKIMDCGMGEWVDENSETSPGIQKAAEYKRQVVENVENGIPRGEEVYLPDIAWCATLLKCAQVDPVVAKQISEVMAPTLDDAKQLISDQLPYIIWSSTETSSDDSNRGVHISNEYGMSFLLSGEEPVRSISVVSKSAGNQIPEIIKVAKPLGWRILDEAGCNWIENDAVSSPSWTDYLTEWHRLVKEHSSGL